MWCMCWKGVGTMAPVERNINSLKYQDINILEENAVASPCQAFPSKWVFFLG